MKRNVPLKGIAIAIFIAGLLCSCATPSAPAISVPTSSPPATATQPVSSPAKAPATQSPLPAPTQTSAPVRGPGVVPTNPPVAGNYVCANGERCIKGNINADGQKIYHFPGCASYAQTQINENAGERWFTTAAEAQAAGWRKAQNCP